jgi:hypothetical protein
MPKKNPPATIQTNDREIATILAALRYWQQDLEENGPGDIIDPDHFAEYKPLTPNQIDRLCERINLHSSTGTVTIHRTQGAEGSLIAVVEGLPKGR